MLMLISGLISILSGVYFLFLPVGGFQGGRNPFYDLIIFFERHTWGDIHTWASIIIIALLLVHIPLHWQWIIRMTKNGARSLFVKNKLNKSSQFNLLINILIGLSGLTCAISGVYFLIVPQAAHGALVGNSSWIFTAVTWDLIHAWSGVVMTSAAILHFGIHWKWVVKVLHRYWNTLMEKISIPKLGSANNEVPAARIEQ